MARKTHRQSFQHMEILIVKVNYTILEYKVLSMNQLFPIL